MHKHFSALLESVNIEVQDVADNQFPMKCYMESKHDIHSQEIDQLPDQFFASRCQYFLSKEAVIIDAEDFQKVEWQSSNQPIYEACAFLKDYLILLSSDLH